MGAVAVTADARHVPAVYSIIAIILCLASVLANGLLELHHDWAVRGLQMGVATVVCALFYELLFRRMLMVHLRRPFPDRGVGGWLESRPAWTMLLAYLVIWLILLAFFEAALVLIHADGQRATLLGMGTAWLLLLWGSAAASLERRRLASCRVRLPR
jgi:hypothetical protein